MNTNDIIVLAVAVVGIAVVAWFFLGKRTRAVKVTGDVEIVVEGGYSPETIEVPVGKPTTIHFFRKDPSSCLEDVVISDLKIRKPLPLNERTDITITPPRPGTYRFSCGMGMYHGAIIAK